MKAKLGLVIYYFLKFLFILSSTLASGNVNECPIVCTCSSKNGNFKVKCQDTSRKFTSLQDFNVEKIPSNTVLLDLSDNAVTHLPRDGFSHLKLLEKLDLKNNNIKIIESHAFYNLSSLKRLDISGNRILELNGSLFDGTPMLERLKLNENNITRISEGAFRSLSKLKHFMAQKRLHRGWIKANSDNLPCVDIFMVTEFLKNDDRFNTDEIRGVKSNCNSRKSYGDSAIGYVQLKRENTICHIKAKICSEHKIHNKAYTVNIIVEEKEQKVLDVNCEDCLAAKGGCKYALALLMWVHHRSEEPSPIEVACYWAKPVLSAVGTSIKFLKASDLHPIMNQKSKPSLDCSNFLKDIIEHGKGKTFDSQIARHNYEVDELHQLSLFQMQLKIVK